MTTAEPWEGLRGRYLAALERSPRASWFEIWRLFLEDPWYQAELAKHARSVIRTTSGSPEWLEDVQHEAALILAAKLQKKPSLGLDSRGMAEKFPATIGTIARNQCRQALKRLRRIYRSGARLLEESDPAVAIGLDELERRSLELSAAIDELPEPLCSVLRLSQLGFDIRTIAERLDISYWQAYRAFKRGLVRIREDLELS